MTGARELRQGDERRPVPARCPICGSDRSHYGCTSVLCRGLDCD
ncbi:hypothetical protein FB474_0683 [Oryzihumus leptocrescens]|uniref:Uncharacterized protein n=1 Tax=Oryzihumus leptocrescens TaxID=297536 RepID=A0A542ZGB0_9MICO|nr:hypothetical protein FB474_0683 [Oryzihumus leptocrescens]